MGAAHCAGRPPLGPEQVQYHGPVPVTDDATPTVQSPFVGAALTAMPLAVPHAPLMADVFGSTLIEKADSVAVAVASLTLIWILESSLTSAGPGVPDNAPVAALNNAQTGMFLIVKVRCAPLALEAAG